MTNFAIYKNTLGYFRLEYEGNILINLKKIDIEPENKGVKSEFTDKVFNEINEYLNGERKIFTVKYKLNGSDFQKKVWGALEKIPYGETRTYKDIAKEIGNEKASRAVGMANNKNPITILVPCHRVIGSNGKLVGYAGGLNMKSKLLDIEKLNRQNEG